MTRSRSDAFPIISVLLGIVTIPTVFCLVGYLTGLAGVLFGASGLAGASKTGSRVAQALALLGILLNSLPMAGYALLAVRVTNATTAAREHAAEVHAVVQELDAAIDDHDDDRVRLLLQRAEEGVLRSEALAPGYTPVVEARDALELRRGFLAAEALVDEAEQAVSEGRDVEATEALDEASGRLDDLGPPISDSRAVEELERRIQAARGG